MLRSKSAKPQNNDDKKHPPKSASKSKIQEKTKLLRTLTEFQEPPSIPDGFPPPQVVTDTLPAGSSEQEYKLWMKKKVAHSEWTSAAKLYHKKKQAGDTAGCQAILLRVNETAKRLQEEIRTHENRQTRRESQQPPSQPSTPRGTRDSADIGPASGSGNFTPRARNNAKTADQSDDAFRMNRASRFLQRSDPAIAEQQQHTAETEDFAFQILMLSDKVADLQTQQNTMQDCITLLLEDQIATVTTNYNASQEALEIANKVEERVPDFDSFPTRPASSHYPQTGAGASLVDDERIQQLERKIDDLGEQVEQGPKGYAQLVRKLIAMEQQMETDRKSQQQQIEILQKNQKQQLETLQKAQLTLQSDIETLTAQVQTLGTVCKRLNQQISDR